MLKSTEPVFYPKPTHHLVCLNTIDFNASTVCYVSLLFSDHINGQFCNAVTNKGSNMFDMSTENQGT